jgi:hypothetical protein
MEYTAEIDAFFLSLGLTDEQLTLLARIAGAQSRELEAACLDQLGRPQVVFAPLGRGE